MSPSLPLTQEDEGVGFTPLAAGDFHLLLPLLPGVADPEDRPGAGPRPAPPPRPSRLLPASASAADPLYGHHSTRRQPMNESSARPS